MISREISVLVGAALLFTATACSSSSSDGGGAAGSGGSGTATASGPVAGDPDTHCKGKSVVVDPAACKTMGMGGAGGGGGAGGMGGGGGAGGGGSAGAAGAGGGAEGGAPGTPTPGANGDCASVDPDYGDIAYGSEADDDDCKYHVKWSVTPFQVGTAASFTVTVTTTADGKPATGLAPRAEVFIPCELTHGPPKVDFAAAATETGPGTYQIGPMTFDKATHWAVRFHFSETCDDSETSPHGHAAFYLAVP
jgi:hypothetical protein